MSSYAWEQQNAENIRRGRIRGAQNLIDQTFSGFNDDFYRQRAQDYINFAMPQLAKQYGDMQGGLTYGWANRGLLGSSAAAKGYSNLNREMGERKQQIVDTGIGQSQDLRRQIEGQRGMLYNQMYSAADPESAASNAIGIASSFGSANAFTPLGQMFSDLMTTYANNRTLSTPPSWNNASSPFFGGLT